MTELITLPNLRWHFRSPQGSVPRVTANRLARLRQLAAVGMWVVTISCGDGEPYRGGSDVNDAGRDSASGAASGTGGNESSGGSNAGAGPPDASSAGEAGSAGDQQGSGGYGGGGGTTAGIRHVIVVSVDGLASHFVDLLATSGQAPTLAALQDRGACTSDARSDPTNTTTLPNHTSMLTALPVNSTPGLPSWQSHGYTFNSTPAPGDTLHNRGNPQLGYIPSIFDVAHDHGRTTALFASKSKFSIYTQSYNDAGRPDLVGTDDGSRKIDHVLIDTNPVAMTDALIAQLTSEPPELTFAHLAEPDASGHATGWGSEIYLSAVRSMDEQLGKILRALDTLSAVAGHTALIVSADHGGYGTSHSAPSNPFNFSIPFCVLAPGVRPGVELYTLLSNRTRPPSPENPASDAPEQPLRNADAGNLALRLLGLPTVDRTRAPILVLEN